MAGYPIVAVQTFIEAIRDSGYKGTSSAVAELVDNALEAQATVVDIELDAVEVSGRQEYTVRVIDTGCGMSPAVMQVALQFGGSTRFNSRRGAGRYGMGLPCSGLSQARRIDLYSWQSPTEIWWTYLDVDEVVEHGLDSVPPPKLIEDGRLAIRIDSKSGTIVVLSRCDRLEYRRVSKLVSKLHHDLGRIFRSALLRGVVVRVNRQPVQPLDPLFLRGSGLMGARPYGPPLELAVRVPGTDQTSNIRVLFSELPVREWYSLPNESKNRYGISKGAGVSILRAGREIDFGWHFTGPKRRENYDDWWRCEIEFEPILDELFGVTHTKQKINPTYALAEILTPHIETAAHELNARVRRAFLKVRGENGARAARLRAEQANGFLEPPKTTGRAPAPSDTMLVKPAGRIAGLRYDLRVRKLQSPSFFVPCLAGRQLRIDINALHPFYEQVYHVASPDILRRVKGIELLLLAFGRAECALPARKDRVSASRLRQEWSRVLAAFLS